MINFETRDIFPDFILADRNGYAMAKAIEAGLKYFIERAKAGIEAVQDIDKMPEWRLDEMAWEYDCLYDYNAGIDAKRDWIRNALRYYQNHGTAKGIEQYLGSYFGEARVVECFQDPSLGAFEFNVEVTGISTEKNERWIRAAVDKAKNVRSVLRNIHFNGGESSSEIMTATANVARYVSIECTTY